jgi:ATP-dependent helicase/nuclease subunit A
LQALLDQERSARQREELNGLYVAMTRARERLVFSRTEPHRLTPSWWQRVEPLVQAWEPVPYQGGRADAHLSTVVLTLPAWAPAAAAPKPARDADSDASRLGQAVHRVLEWASAHAGRQADMAHLAQAAASEFSAPAGEVARLAGTIWHSPACQPFFLHAALRWAGNEVPVADAGDLLRIDRLVQLEDGVWWVLDYKLALQPQAQAEYRAQMLRYRQAVQSLQPGETVRCALINGQGSVIEIT